MMPIDKMGPVRVQLSRKKGWRMPENTVKVDRSGPYGNPARVVLDKMIGTDTEDEDGNEILVGPWCCTISKEGAPLAGWWFSTEAEARAKAVEYFRYLVTESPGAQSWQDKASQLQGRNVACWCGLDQACHGDIWLERARVSASTIGEGGSDGVR